MSAAAPGGGGGAMPRAAHAEIDLGALRHNLARVREAAPRSRILAAVKADAYGHGLLTVAEALQGVDGYAVASVGEGLLLREAGLPGVILALQGFADAEELGLAAERDIELTVHAEHQLALLERSPPPRAVGVWLKIDTGMHRLGFAPQEVAGVHRRLRAMPAVRGTPRLMTHLARADEPRSEATARQVAVFDACAQGLAGEQSIANSAGVLAWPQTHRHWVRPGIMLYGASPFVNGDALAEGLRPVMTLKAPLVAVRRLRRGDAVGYGGSYVCPEDMPVGVAAIGYGDGYPRQAGEGAPVLVNGRRTRLLGRVCMDVVTVDLRGIEARVGDEVVLWGEGLPADEVARAAGTISYELFCRVGGRVAVRLRG